MTSAFRRAFGNFSVLMAGRAVAGAVSLLAVTLAARLLGPTDFGVLVLLHTTAMVVRGIANFKPSDTVVRYGVEPFDSQQRLGFERLLRFTSGLDVLTAGLSASAMAVLVVFAAPSLGLPEALQAPALCYVLALLLSGTGTAKGVLRVANRFDAISVQQTVGPLVRLSGIGVAYMLQAGLAGYVLAWVCASICEYAYLNLRGWRELRRQGYGLSAPGLKRPEDLPDIWRFVRTLYWQSNLELAQRHGLVLLAGALVGPAGVGIFRIAREFADVLAKPVVVIRQAVFPDLARLGVAGDGEFRGLYLKIGAVSAAVGGLVLALAWLYAADLLAVLVGDQFVAGAGLLVWLMAAAAVDLAAAALRPAAYAAGVAGISLRVQLFGAAVNIGLFLLLVPITGLIGAGVAALAASATMAGAMLWVLANVTPEAGLQMQK